MSKAKLSALDARELKLMTELRKLREVKNWAETKKRKAHILSLIGRRFKFQNSYGAGEVWWAYRTIVDVSDDGQAVICSFQTDCHGKSTIELNQKDWSCGPRFELSRGWENCSHKEYSRELKAIKAKMRVLE